MNRLKDLKKYVDRLVEGLSPNLRRGLHLSSVIHPVDGEGAVIELHIGDAHRPSTTQAPSPTLGKALESVKQTAIGGDLSGITFRGTNIVFESHRIVLIKGGNDQNEWSRRAAQNDLKRVLAKPPEIAEK